MKKRWLCVGASCAIWLSGCQLMTSMDAVTEHYTEATEETTTEATTEATGEVMVTLPQEVESQIASVAESDREEREQDELPVLLPPVDEDGQWLDYDLHTVELHPEFWDPKKNKELGTFGVRFDVTNYPIMYCRTDSDLQKKLNQVLEENVRNDYRHRFQMKDLKLELNCEIKNADSRFVSFALTGMIYHVGSDSRYLDEKEYRYYFTMDRMTGNLINLDTAMGKENVRDAITAGRFSVVNEDKHVVMGIPKKMVAEMYLDNPMFEEDITHLRDWYFEDGKLCVCIWVGDQRGGYAILKLKDTPDLMTLEKKMAEETATMEEETGEVAQEDTTAEAAN